MHQLPTELSDPCYHDDEAARAMLESIRWPDGPFCPYCGSFDTVKPTTTPPKAKGGGWFHCRACRKRFTVRVGSIFHRSHAPMHKWLLAFRLMLGSKKGFSAHQLHRTLNVDYKTAWFMEHRIRECMDMDSAGPLGGEGKTFVNKQRGRGTWVFSNEKQRWIKVRDRRSLAAFALVERGGRARANPINNTTANELRGCFEEVRGHPQRAHDRRMERLSAPRPRVRWPRYREPFRRRVDSLGKRQDGRHTNRRELLLGFQAGHAWRLPALQR
jgi:transposase-like protein